MLRCLLLSMLGCSCLAGCSVTVGAIDGTSDSVANTTDSAGESAEAAVGFTSSTSPRGDGGPDQTAEVARRQREALEFVRANPESVRRDIAAGGGEYLTALAEIFAVDPQERPQFYANSKQLFLKLYCPQSEPAIERRSADCNPGKDSDSREVVSELFRLSAG